MNNTVPVRAIESTGNLDRISKGFFQRQRSLLQPLCKSLSVEILHDDVSGAVIVADIIELANVRMIEAGDGASFTLESLAVFGPGFRSMPQDLDRYSALEAQVFRSIDFTHAPSAKQGHDFIRPQPVS
jgi:hypothetical protein